MGNRKITLKTIKNRDSIHPYSRKAHQISRVYQRREKLAQQEKKKQSNPKGERWLWFKEAFGEEKSVATKPELQQLIEIYLQRHDEEIEQLEQERNRGHRKPKSSRQELLESIKESEKNEYASGMELPDMTNGKVLKLLREWNGDKNGMSRIATIRIHKPDEGKQQQPSTTPNKNQENDKKDMMEL
ncbi:MAG: translation machinery-associated protein 16 [Benjaminiella poitrasii]|nr:MAG: translation machinery-associated protein 16 [Benjaminiella poitrasii]